VARDIIRAAVGSIFGGYFASADLRQVTEWFDLGGTLQVDDAVDARELLARTAQVQGLADLTTHTGVGADAAAPVMASAVDFILEGLYAQKKITRSDEFQYQAAEPPRRPVRPPQAEPAIERDIPLPGNKKKYYN
jgi:magnesium chelatase subunit I